MNNETLTEHMIKVVEAVARIEENTSCVPEIKKSVDNMYIHVHDNTQCREIIEKKIPDIDKNTTFRKNSVKVIWISVSAAIAGFSGLIISLIGLRK